jgi:hypothetical protein
MEQTIKLLAHKELKMFQFRDEVVMVIIEIGKRREVNNENGDGVSVVEVCCC